MVGVAFAGVFLAILVYRLFFIYIKARWGLPLVFNGIGAIFMSAGAFMFWMFLTNDAGDAHNFRMPEVPITVPATYILLSVLWYVVTIKLFLAFIDATKPKKGAVWKGVK